MIGSKKRSDSKGKDIEKIGEFLKALGMTICHAERFLRLDKTENENKISY